LFFQAALTVCLPRRLSEMEEEKKKQDAAVADARSLEREVERLK
jgi:hypothetical protein